MFVYRQLASPSVVIRPSMAIYWGYEKTAWPGDLAGLPPPPVVPPPPCPPLVSVDIREGWGVGFIGPCWAMALPFGNVERMFLTAPATISNAFSFVVPAGRPPFNLS